MSEQEESHTELEARCADLLAKSKAVQEKCAEQTERIQVLLELSETTVATAKVLVHKA